MHGLLEIDLYLSLPEPTVVFPGAAVGRTARGHFFLIYQSIARSTPPGCVGAVIPSAPLSLRLVPAATAVVEMVVVRKCK